MGRQAKLAVFCTARCSIAQGQPPYRPGTEGLSVQSPALRETGTMVAPALACQSTMRGTVNVRRIGRRKKSPRSEPTRQWAVPRDPKRSRQRSCSSRHTRIRATSPERCSRCLAARRRPPENASRKSPGGGGLLITAAVAGYHNIHRTQGERPNGYDRDRNFQEPPSRRPGD